MKPLCILFLGHVLFVTAAGAGPSLLLAAVDSPSACIAFPGCDSVSAQVSQVGQVDISIWVNNVDFFDRATFFLQVPAGYSYLTFQPSCAISGTINYVLESRLVEFQFTGTGPPLTRTVYLGTIGIEAPGPGSVLFVGDARIVDNRVEYQIPESGRGRFGVGGIQGFLPCVDGVPVQAVSWSLIKAGGARR